MDEKTIARFWIKVDKRGPDECWPWLGRPNGTGYGCFGANKRTCNAHRFSYILHAGIAQDDIAGLDVRHSCDNPACCNPRHLTLGSRKQNMADMIERGRLPRGSARAWAKLTEQDIPLIRELLARGESLKKVAAQFGVTTGPIWNIANGRRWRHV
jgi:hypothetical protein